jgi:hypothetical protein
MIAHASFWHEYLQEDVKKVAAVGIDEALIPFGFDNRVTAEVMFQCLVNPFPQALYDEVLRDCKATVRALIFRLRDPVHELGRPNISYGCRQSLGDSSGPLPFVVLEETGIVVAVLADVPS